MYTDLAEHFGLIMALVSILGGAVVYLIWKFLIDLRSDIKDLSKEFRTFLSTAVTREEYDRKHESLLRLLIEVAAGRPINNADIQH